MTRPFRPSGRPSAQDANGSSFAPIPTPRGSRLVAAPPPPFNSEPGGRRLRARFPMRAQSDAMTRKPCPPPLQGGGKASRRKNRRMGRSPFPPAPLFSRPPLFVPSSTPPPSFCWMLRVGPSTGDVFRGSARQGSSDCKTPPADHRSGPTSWARRRRVSRAAFANQQRRQTRRTKPPSAKVTPLWRSPPDSLRPRAPLNAGRLAPSAPFPDPIQRRFGARRGGAWSRGGDEEE